MKKPTSRVAIGFWLVAFLYAVADTWLQWRAITYSPYAPYIPLHTNVAQLLHDLLESIAMVSGGLTAAGFLIDLLDQIRWNALPPEQRKRR